MNAPVESNAPVAQAGEQAQRLKVLVADDDLVARRLVVGTLRNRFQVIEASNGREAVELFEAKQPDFVLLDVDMPIMSGVEATVAMRAMIGDRYVPILLLSALDEVSTLVAGLAHGADDFLPKPFNARVFDSKLLVFLRIREMQNRLREQNEQLEGFRARTQEEHALAQEIFTRQQTRGAGEDPRVRISASAMALFNGDVALTARTPSGRFRWLLADVAGHGLAGAIGTVPVTSAFYRCTKHELSLATTVSQINDELRSTLPPRLFCAASAFELDPSRRELTVINCGMPDAEVLQADGTLLHLGSLNVPLGIIDQLEPQAQTLHVEAGTRVIAVSDGVIECVDAAGAMLGPDHFRAVLARGPSELAFERVLETVRQFTGGAQSDDVSVLEVLV
jgi:two-component system, HptB-dependent secretion and biofilm response regulator